jgi:DNA transposition AAA+ family ATPase
MEEVKKLKKFKKDSGWSFEKIAREMGISHQTVMAWFSGKYKPSALAQKAIQEFLEKQSSRGKR